MCSCEEARGRWPQEGDILEGDILEGNILEVENWKGTESSGLLRTDFRGALTCVFLSPRDVILNDKTFH